MQAPLPARRPDGLRSTSACAELLTLVGDLLATRSVDGVGRAAQLLQCLACPGNAGNRRCDTCQRGGHSTLDHQSAAFRSLVDAAPELAVAMRAFATDPIVSLLAVARRDRPDLFEHSVCVARIAGAIASRLGTLEGVRNAIVAAAMFHDLGKLLRRAAPEEDAHGDLTQALLVACSIASPVARAAAQHHEHLDGTGSPHGLSGDQIGIGGRILVVSEVIAATIDPLGEMVDGALLPLVDDLLSGAGTHYDGTVAVIAAAMLSAGELVILLAQRPGHASAMPILHG